MNRRAIAAARGFTLIELMVVVAIVGLLSSIAIPEFARATLRARSAERATVMEALARAVNDTISQQQRVPGGTWTAVANPPGTPGTSKRKFDWTAAGWAQVPLIVEGDAYYSYGFVARDPTNDGRNVTLTITGDGDLDGDGVPSNKSMVYQGVGYAFALVSETPAAGMENLTTF